MVAIRASDAERFLAKLPEHVFLYLFFGTDSGLVNERARSTVRRSIADATDPFQIVRLDGDEVASDPLRLADEANTIGLFGGKRALWLNAGAKSLIPALEPLFNATPRDCTIVIEAGALKKDSPLRRIVEQQKGAAAVECNADDAAALERVVDQDIAAAGLTIDPEARALLISLLGDNRLMTRAELSKLTLYAHGTGQIDVTAVETIIADASALVTDAAINGAFAGRFDLVTETLSRAFATGTDAGVLLGQALRHAIALHRVKLEADRGMPLEAAVDRMARGPYSVRQAMLSQAKTWQTARLARAVDILAEAVRRTRREPVLAEAIGMRALWSIALAARPRGD